MIQKVALLDLTYAQFSFPEWRLFTNLVSVRCPACYKSVRDFQSLECHLRSELMQVISALV